MERPAAPTRGGASLIQGCPKAAERAACEARKAIVLNRTSFRGVTAVLVTGGIISGALLTGGNLASTALASVTGAESHSAAAALAPEYMTRELPQHMLIRPVPKPKPKPKPKPAPKKAASRAHVRQALTGSPQTIAHAMVLNRGWSESQFSCLVTLWNRESGWNTYAANPSGAYGIPQALPGSKMATMGSDWRTNPVTQIRWGLSYIAASYGTPCVALSHSYRYNYY